MFFSDCGGVSGMTKKRTPVAVIAPNILLWCGFGYIGLATAALHLGEVMHDIHCQDHR